MFTFPHLEATNVATDPPLTEFKCPGPCREKEAETAFYRAGRTLFFHLLCFAVKRNN